MIFQEISENSDNDINTCTGTLQKKNPPLYIK